MVYISRIYIVMSDVLRPKLRPLIEVKLWMCLCWWRNDLSLKQCKVLLSEWSMESEWFILSKTLPWTYTSLSRGSISTGSRTIWKDQPGHTEWCRRTLLIYTTLHENGELQVWSKYELLVSFIKKNKNCLRTINSRVKNCRKNLSMRIVPIWWNV